MRVALVHDWLTGMRGGERVLESLLDLFPAADLFTLVHVPGTVAPAIEARPIQTSFIQRLPGAPRRFRQYLPLFPLAVRRFDLRGYDLVLATSHCVAVGARPPVGAAHVVYCLTPMRYAWTFEGTYLGRVPPLTRGALRFALAALRRWDRAAGRRAGHLACISRHVALRIQRAWGRQARVLYPPVRTAFFRPCETGAVGDAYLCVSALTPYKRVDVAVDACTRLGRRLDVIGAGPELERLRRRAGPTVRFLGWQPDEAVRAAVVGCRAFLFPGEEEFGIAPLEASAAGRPVIAYGRGALTETVVDGVTGLFFREQTADALIDAIGRHEVTGWSPEKIRAHALRFGEEAFRAEMAAFVEAALRAARGAPAAC
ncbi:MAG TPA: glycosyltransferase [Methylomirabilota bacterium]|jgi:glycosyltransferase involved in cell wall biosynthesis|nr:glycosyltransferase [Methylomirabilota bacterium]